MHKPQLFGIANDSDPIVDEFHLLLEGGFNGSLVASHGLH